MYTATAKGGVFLPHFTVWSARAMFERETGRCLLSAESNSLPLLQGMRLKRLVVFAKKAKERKKITAKDTVEVVREACRTTHWKRPSTEGFYRLQTYFRIEQPGILDCLSMWSGSCFQTFRRNATPHIKGCMSVNSLSHSSAISRKPRTNASEWALEKSMRAHSNQGCWFWDRSDC
jgi:hypothetical protein